MRRRVPGQSTRTWTKLAGFRLSARITVGAAALAVVFAVSCGFHPRLQVFELCDGFDQLGNSVFTADPPIVVLEDPGTIQVLHGNARASSPTGVMLKIEQSVALPAYANQAAVFLNGWRLGYKNSDHHVWGLGTAIARIRVERGKITWNAAAMLTDNDGEEPYNWEYRFTVIAWNDAVLHAMIDQNDTEQFCKSKQPDGSDNMFAADNEGMTTALSTFPSFLQNPGFATGRAVAVLPRGYGFAFADDHHLLQLAYNLESAAPFLRSESYYKVFTTVKPLQNPTSAIAAGEFVSWKTSVIMKDDDDRRFYDFTEVVSGMGGSDVEIIQPEFTLRPFDSASGAFGGAGVKSASVVIEHLPYAYAIPLLTGWDIGYSGSDQHVKDIGLWLDNLHYDPPSTVHPTGTLTYRVSSIVKDDDDFPDNYFRHKVTILGLRPLPTGSRTKPAGGVGVPSDR